MSALATGDPPGSVVALSGGIGGAKLALGLARILPAGALSVIANTGDDFEHLGLTISPDIDTLVYTLAGLSNTQQGWGRAGETWSFMAALKALGGPDWFQLGDGDLAMHVVRSHRLAGGETLSAITADLARAAGVDTKILPMADSAVRTKLETRDGLLDFQDYFVRLRAEPVITGDPVCGGGGGQCDGGGPAGSGAGGPGCDRDCALQPADQHRADSGGAGDASCDPGGGRSGGRGVADHSGDGGEGANREDAR